MKNNIRILKEYIQILFELSGSPDISSLGAIVRDYENKKEVVLFRYDIIYSALSRRKADENVFDFLVSNIRNSIVGYAIFGLPDQGEAYGAWEVTHVAGPGYGKILYAIGYALSPHGLLMPDRNQVSPEASMAWKRASTSRKSLKLDDLPPNNKTKTPNDDAKLHQRSGQEYLDYAYEEQGWEKGIAARLITQGNAALKEISDDVNRDRGAILKAFISMGTHFFRDQYSEMLKRKTG